MRLLLPVPVEENMVDIVAAAEIELRWYVFSKITAAIVFGGAFRTCSCDDDDGRPTAEAVGLS